MFKHFLVPLDGSDLSLRAATQAVELAKESDARITFFYAKPDYPVAFFGEGALIDPTTPEMFADMATRQSDEILARACSLAQRAGVTHACAAAVSDAPYEAIIEAAGQVGCDLIFMASHGRRGIGALLLGSETQKVLTHSRLPVLVYR